MLSDWCSYIVEVHIKWGNFYNCHVSFISVSIFIFCLIYGYGICSSLCNCSVFYGWNLQCLSRLHVSFYKEISRRGYWFTSIFIFSIPSTTIIMFLQSQYLLGALLAYTWLFIYSVIFIFGYYCKLWGIILNLKFDITNLLLYILEGNPVNELYVRKMNIIKLLCIMLKFYECKLMYFEQIEAILFV
jgi:hypothetical protein